MAHSNSYDLLLQATLSLCSQNELAELGRAFVRITAQALGAHSAMLYDILTGSDGQFSLRPSQGLALYRSLGTERTGSPRHAIATQMLAQGEHRRLIASDRPEQTAQLYFLLEAHAKVRQWLAVTDVTCPSAAQLASDFASVYRQCYKLVEENCTDSLTGLYNRKPFIACMHEILQRQSEQDAPPGQTNECLLGVVDVDRFKSINDQFGHVIGDEVLLLVSRLLRDSFRASDFVFRFGGEEFVVLLPATALRAGAGVFERCRQRIAGTLFPQVERVTASIGFTSVYPGKLPMTFVDEADRALYRAKQLGRNRVCDFAEIEAVERTGSVELF